MHTTGISSSPIAADYTAAHSKIAAYIHAAAIFGIVIGNIAAGIVVKQYGCATTSIDEIIKSIPTEIKLEEC